MGMKLQAGRTVVFSSRPTALGWANCVGKKEGEGPLSACFDYIAQDDSFGQSSWEKAEQTMQKQALSLALEKTGLTASDVDFLFAGDLLNQCITSGYAARGRDIPFFGLYGACSTMGEGLILAAMALDGGFGQRAAAVASSHFCSAERQYRTPLEYGGQRTPTAQWTVTGAGAVILGTNAAGPRLTHATVGRVVDKGIKDANNMGAAMAPEDVKLTPCVTHISVCGTAFYTQFFSKRSSLRKQERRWCFSLLAQRKNRPETKRFPGGSFCFILGYQPIPMEGCSGALGWGGTGASGWRG